MFVFAALSLFMYNDAFGWSCYDEDSCYKVSETTMEWEEAVDFCLGIGGELASVHSAEENEFINSICTGSGSRCWIGLSDILNEGEFVWSDGSDLDFLYWLSGEPNNNRGSEHYVHLGSDFGGYWNDVPVQSYYAICKGWSCYDEGTCYKVSTSTMNWPEAVDYCRDIGGDLTSVHSAEENDFIYSMCTSGSCWIGLNDIDNEGEFVWSDGSDLDFLHWRSGEPNSYEGEEDYVHLWDSYNGYWNDNGVQSYNAICKWSPAPSGEPTPAPSSEPSPAPSSEPTPAPSSVPSPSPSTKPTPTPSSEPSPDPSRDPSPAPSSEPTPTPSSEPSPSPSNYPSPAPSSEPTQTPSSEPSPAPSSEPSPTPSSEPSPDPSPAPSNEPSPAPSSQPTPTPSSQPSPTPSSEPDDTILLLGMSFGMSHIVMVLFALLICSCLVLCCCAVIFARQRKYNFKKERIEMVVNGVQPGETDGAVV